LPYPPRQYSDYPASRAPQVYCAPSLCFKALIAVVSPSIPTFRCVDKFAPVIPYNSAYVIRLVLSSLVLWDGGWTAAPEWQIFSHPVNFQPVGTVKLTTGSTPYSQFASSIHAEFCLSLFPTSTECISCMRTLVAETALSRTLTSPHSTASPAEFQIPFCPATAFPWSSHAHSSTLEFFRPFTVFEVSSACIYFLRFADSLHDFLFSSHRVWLAPERVLLSRQQTENHAGWSLICFAVNSFVICLICKTW